MTPQEIFDTVIPLLQKQGSRSSASEGGACLYRNPKGHKCAVGHLIPDDRYVPGMDGQGLAEGLDVDELLEAYPDALPFEVDPETLSFLCDFQDLHDFRSNWDEQGLKPEAIRRFASRWGLSTARALDK